MADFTPQSRNEAILDATINGTEYTALPQSRIEALLIQLKNKIEEGGGIVIDDAMSDVSTNAVENKIIKAYVDNEIDKAVDACYHPAGSKTCAELISALLIADNLGNVYNTTDTGTTTADFVEGAGKTIDLGSDVAIVNIGTSENPVYKFNVLGGFVDLSNINEDISNLQTTISSNGAKNLLPMTLDGIKALNTTGTWVGNVYTESGVTFTVNTDSNGNVTGISTSGTAEYNAYIRLALKVPFADAIKCNGLSINGSDSTFGLQIVDSTNTVIQNIYTTDDCYMVAGTYGMRIIISSGYNSTGKTFYPMIRLASDTDNTFQPYAKTNLELTDDIRDVNHRLENNACVNLLDVNKCVSVTSSVIRYPAMNFLANKGETFYFTFNNGGTRQVAYAITDSNGTTTYDSGWQSTGEYEITMPADGSIFVAFKYSDNSAITISDVLNTFRPMLSKIKNATYEPYYPNNKELASTRPELKSKTFSGATLSNGNFNLDLSNTIIVSVMINNPINNEYYVALPFYNDFQSWIHVISASYSNTTGAQLNITGTVYYYER